MHRNRLLSLLCPALLIVMIGCRPTEEASSSEEPLFFECGDGLRYPTTESDFRTLYAGRAFDALGHVWRGGVLVATYHSGHDILYEEGTAVRAIACGTVVVYRASIGYGTLAAVIEHRLSRPVQVHNGDNELVTISAFLSIYGHIRRTSGINGGGVDTGLRTGLPVLAGRIVGYVQHADERPGHAAEDLNGDGAEHLHLGIRLQSSEEASRVDPSAWFRGYDDASHTYRGYFANPAIFMRELMEAHPVLWHPPGTLLMNREDHSRWLVGADDTIHPVDETYLIRERLAGREMEVSAAEIGCYQHGSVLPYETWLSTLIRFEDSPAVYESGMYRFTNDRYTFISHEAFVSWGWTDSRVERWSSSNRDAFFARTTDRGYRRIRDGTLVQARGASEVSVVSEGRRLPFQNWETFVAMGYDSADIVELDPSAIDEAAYPRGAMITPDLARLCRVPSCSGSSCAGAGMSGGGGVEDPDAGPPALSDAGMPSGMGCSSDGDCAFGWRCESSVCREWDLDGDGYLESAGDCNPEAARVHPGATEVCGGGDDDCDTRVDEGIDLSSDPNNCGSCNHICIDSTCVSGSCVAPCSASPEVCGDGVDNNCNGMADEGCAPVCTAVAEICDARDQDCDTRIDESLSQACSTACGAGTETCSAGRWVGCTARVPSSETCNGLDDNCVGGIDEGLFRACSTTCGSGTETCSLGRYVGCTAPLPGTETCNGRDDNCDGRIDEGVCAPACVPTSPSRDICDGRDNDCDGTIDNGCPAMNPYLVEIWMDPSMLDDCPDPGGFRINLWGPGGVALQNVIGQPFRQTITSSWVTATPISLSCSVAPSWHDWSGHVGESSSSNGVLVMRLGGRDMLPTSLVCNDMVDPAWGAKPYMPLESRYEGSCTPRW